MIPRIDEIAGEPIIGRYYLVPTVLATWHDKLGEWPVIGPKHHDAHCLNFKWTHYHLDARFVPSSSKDYHFWRSVMASPVMTSERINPEGLPEPVWRRRTCRRLANPFQSKICDDAAAVAGDAWKCHFSEWAGRQAKRDARRWICPHRNVSLAGQLIVDGVITCPLHLLRIDAETGVVLPAKGVDA